MLRDLCDTIRSDDQIIRSPTFKILLDNFDEIYHDELMRIMKEEEPVGWHVATRTLERMAELETNVSELSGRLEEANAVCAVLRNAEDKARQLAAVVKGVKDIIGTMGPKCKSCRGKIKNSWGYFSLNWTDEGPDGSKVDPPTYYITC